MIGLDRPLKPEWIYDVLRMVEPGETPSAYNLSFETIAGELVGKEGKRKARTIIFRSFIYSLQEEKNTIRENLFIQWARHHTLDHMKPLFLIKILIDYEIARFLVQKMMISIDSSNQLSIPLLSKSMVKVYGDRDVVKRSLRAFLSSLVNFGILIRKDPDTFFISQKMPLSHEQVKKIIILYANYFTRSKVVNLKEIQPEFFYFFQPVDMNGTAIEFNGEDWEYIREVGRDILFLAQ